MKLVMLLTDSTLPILHQYIISMQYFDFTEALSRNYSAHLIDKAQPSCAAVNSYSQLSIMAAYRKPEPHPVCRTTPASR